MTEAHTELERLAKLATQGEWEFIEFENNLGGVGSSIVSGSKNICHDETYYPSAPSQKDMQFIAAANPAAILSLLADIRRLEEEIKTMRNSVLDEAAKLCEENIEGTKIRSSERSLSPHFKEDGSIHSGMTYAREIRKMQF